MYEKKDKLNKYTAVYYSLRNDILRGRYRGGEKLPSKRALAEELGVSVITVQLAYEQLLAEGYVYSVERSGYFAERITGVHSPSKRAEIKQKPRTDGNGKFKIDFVKSGVPAELFPFSVWTKLIRAVLADCGEHLLERVPFDGDAELKQAVSDYLYRSRGIDADPERIVIGGGAEHLYGVIVQLLGRDKVFALENPNYALIASTYLLNGARVFPIPVIGAGICLNERDFCNFDVLHISPSHQFPTGEVITAGARSRLIEWAKASGGYIIEDDYDSEFRLTGRPLQSMYSLCPDRVIYMNTFSKTLAPSMRMGYMVLPPELYEKFSERFSSGANIVPLFEQKTLAAFIGGGYFERHITRLRHYYKGVREELLKKFAAAGADCTVNDTGSGLHFTAEFHSARDDGQIKANALKRGVNVKCLSDYLIAPLEGVERRAVINYAGLTKENISGFDAACFFD